ncbi:restriction endonuclease subunit S, partial [Staphylococcus aureus]|nr:restriction endonuclease subunit S [Staphylococcus aureus]
LYPYYGATGETGKIDDYLLDETTILVGEDGAPFLDKYAIKAYKVSGKYWVNNHAHILRALIEEDFLLNYLNYFDYTGYVNGTTRLKLTQTSLQSIPIIV